MNKSLIFIGIAAVAFFAIRSQMEPTFSIESYDSIRKQGTFSFGGNINSFSFMGGGSATSRNGYVINYSTNNGKIIFDLYKDGNFIKRVHEI